MQGTVHRAYLGLHGFLSPTSRGSRLQHNHSIIFTCNMRGTGFHYHKTPEHRTRSNLSSQQSCANIRILITARRWYWKPLLNFSTAPKESNVNNVAPADSISDGVVHVQRAGLQKMAHHGIFHSRRHEKSALHIVLPSYCKAGCCRDCFLSMLEKVVTVRVRL